MCICDKLCPAVRRGIEIEFCQQNYEIEKVTEVYPSFFLILSLLAPRQCNEVTQGKTRITQEFTQEFTQEKSAAYATLFLSLTPFLSVISDTCPFSALGSCFQ